MKYRGMGVTANFIVYLVGLLLFGGMTVFALACSIFTKTYIVLPILLVGYGMFDLFILWVGKRIVRIVEIYDDKIVFIPFILRHKRKELHIGEIEQIRVIEALAYGMKNKKMVKGIFKHYGFEFKENDKVVSSLAYWLQSTPEIDKIIEDVFKPYVPIIEDDTPSSEWKIVL